MQDLPRPQSSFAGVLAMQLPPTNRMIGCANFFPAKGGMGWHTDSHRPGWRIYAFHNLSVSCLNVFRYRSQEFSEAAEFGAYVFQVGADCWHSISCETPRVSCGFQISEMEAKAIVTSERDATWEAI